MFEFLFLGTGAADWDIKNRNGFFRRNSAALVNNNLMIDCGSHIFDFANEYGNRELYSSVSDIIITHSHSDHFCKHSVLKIAQNQKIRLGCDGNIKNIIGENENIEFVVFEPYKQVHMGEYIITPLLANHDVVARGDCYAFHYIIETGGKKIFYGLDGAWLLRPTWQEMKNHKFDLMIFDCTVGDSHDWRIFEHNTIPMLRAMVKEIAQQNLLNQNGRLVASHLARTLHGSHEQTERILAELDMLTAYDGMKLNL